MNILDIKTLFDRYSKDASEILKEPAKTQDFLESCLPKIRNPKAQSLVAKIPVLLKYVASSRVPAGNKLKIIAGILYLVSPLSLPGPMDEILVAAWLLPYVNEELNRFTSGEYDARPCQESREEPLKSGNPLKDGVLLTRNPLVD